MKFADDLLPSRETNWYRIGLQKPMPPRIQADGVDSISTGGVARARNFRRMQNPVERKLWQLLRDRRLKGHKFRRQFPVGDFVADFCCLDKRLIVEIDGGYHEGVAEADQARQQTLEALGFRIVRFWASEVIREPEHVLERILYFLQE
jgi:very-short-patch-repair endonuclease